METKSLKKTKLCHFETSYDLAEIKVVYKSKQKNKVKITNSKDVFDVIFPLFDKGTVGYQEQFYLLLLNYANCVLGWVRLSIGGTFKTVVDPKIIFALALKTNASGIILAHNHPSGNLSPSHCDEELTRRISEVGRLLEIKLLDHLIVSPEESYLSFADEGKVP